MKQPFDLTSNHSPILLFEDTLSTREDAWLFTEPQHEIKATNPIELLLALRQIDQLRKQGYYLAGYLAYEAAYALQHPLEKLQWPADSSSPPLLQFYAFTAAQRIPSVAVTAALQQLPESPPFIDELHYSEAPAEYADTLRRIRAYIESGDTYQVNHTLRLNFELRGTINGLYQALRERQPVAYSALFHLPNQSILSLSPELFISKRGSTLSSKPMKGTAARGADPDTDQRIIVAMRADEKLRAENLMIVDLMRNDIGRIAHSGSVRVEGLFEVQSYQTVHQMVSTVYGEIDPALDFETVVRHLFPCGSITGAPKIRTMEIIRELESSPRQLYTGALGFITPDNDFTFNVPIRTISFPANSQCGRLGVGGGIIYDSQTAAEWQECRLKTSFLTGLNQAFQLIETFRFDHVAQQILRLEQHIKRLQDSAGYFGYPCDPDAIRHQLDAFLGAAQATMAKHPTDLKIRLLLNAQGEVQLSMEALDPSVQLVQLATDPVELPPMTYRSTLPTISISPHRIEADNLFRRHKTTNRSLYNRAYQAAEQQGHYDVVFFNQHGHCAEASRHNLLISKAGQLITPPLSDGALPGVMRQTLIATSRQPIIERSITREDMQAADQLYLCNSVRGVLEVRMATVPLAGST